MAAYSYPGGAPTNNVYLDSLIWGNSLASSSGQSTEITWSYGSGAVQYDGKSYQFPAWQSYEITAVQEAMQAWDDVCNASFVYVSNPASAMLLEYVATASDMTQLAGDESTLGLHDVPSAGSDAALNGFYKNSGSGWNSTGLLRGGEGFNTLVHEIGHGLGLAHPHDGGGGSDATVFPGVTSAFGSYGDYSLNQQIWTIMSYNSGWVQQPIPSGVEDYGGASSPMALDIAAIQAIYGANNSFRTGDDTYTLPSSNASGTYWSCIWDAGGTDLITAGSGTLAVEINLNAATLSGTNAGGYVSYASGIVGGYTIANSVSIENATGGSAGDTLTGNDLGNMLTGNAGNDTLTGGAGNDTVYGNTDNDTLYGNTGGDTLYGGQGVDTLYGGQDADYVYGNYGNDTIYANLGDDYAHGGADDDYMHGGAGNDTMLGGLGNDTLVGGAGNDTLTGGDGADIFQFLNSHGVDVIADFNAASDTIKLQSNINDTGVTDGASMLSRVSTVSGNAVIDLGNGNSITLTGVSASALTADDFTFS